MPKIFRVRYKGGVLVPEEPLDMEENKGLLIKIIGVEEMNNYEWQKYLEPT